MAHAFFFGRDAVFLGEAGGFVKLHVSGIERHAHVVEEQAEVVTRTVLGQHAAFAVHDLAAHGGQPDTAVCLGFQMLLIFVYGDDLHPPEPGEQNAHPHRHHHRDEAELRVILFQFVDD